MPEKIPVAFGDEEKVEIPVVHVVHAGVSVEQASTNNAEKAERRLLESPSVERAIFAIQEEFPDLEVKSQKTHLIGKDNLVFEVNGESIFKFPVKEIARGECEMNVLRLLEGKTTAAVPKVLYTGERKFFFGTDKMQGVHLDDEMYRGASESEKGALSEDIARFLSELHANVPVERADQIGIRKDNVFEEWTPQRLYPLIEQAASGDLGFRGFLMKAVDAFQHAESRDRVFLHHDLATNNFFVNPENRRLNGVIDFDRAATGSRYIDFASLYRNNEALGLAVAEKYSKITGIAVDSQLVRATAVVKELIQLGKQDKPPEERQKSLDKLKQWYAKS